MLKSPNDNREYLNFSLANGLEVLLIEDLESNKAAASISVKIGQFNDPENLPGLSHMLEHMLFLGSENFPTPGCFGDFISEHGGQTNAWTGTELSSYFFDVKATNFAAALAHFADLIFAALLRAENVDNEKKVIDAEFQLKQKDDLRRLYQVHKETCNPQHPFSKFAVGNLATFGKISNQRLTNLLTEHYKKYYVASNCKLVLSSPEKLAKQRSLVEQLFTTYHSGCIHQQQISAPLYLQHQLGVEINVRPLNKASRLILTFSLPSQDNHYRYKPIHYISHLLGYEGKGSLLAYLKARGWVNKLSAGGGISGSNFKDFNINMQLTPEGIEVYQEIIKTVFGYIRLIKEQGIELWRFEENQQLAHIAFDGLEKDSPANTVTTLANNMFQYPANDLYWGDFVFETFKPELIRELLSYMSPENLRVKKIWQELETDQCAAHYQTEYKITPVTSETLQCWQQVDIHDDLQLPAKNPYLCKRFAPLAIEEQQSLPTQIVDSEHMSVWHLQESVFLSAKGTVRISLSNSSMCQSARHSVLKRLMTNLLLDELNELYYSADAAGLGYDIYVAQSGIGITTSGFSEPQLRLLTEFIDGMAKVVFRSGRFASVKHQLTTNLTNSLNAKPVSQLFSSISEIFQPNHYNSETLLAELDSIELNELQQYRQQFFNKLHVDAFIHGDWPASLIANELTNIEACFKHFSISGNDYSATVNKLDGKGAWFQQATSLHTDSAIAFYFQGTACDAEQTSHFILLEQLISSEFFNQIRTQQQLGYAVGVGYMPINQLPGIAAYVQSPSHSVNDLYCAVSAFFNELPKQVLNLPEQLLSQVKSAVVHQLTQADVNFAAKNQRLWVAIANKDTNFDFQHQVVKSLQAITLNSFNQFVADMICGENQLLISYCEGKRGKAEFIPIENENVGLNPLNS